MGQELRWDPCVAHRGDDVDRFLTHYFGQPDRKVLFVAGAGFDPRSCTVAYRLNEVGANMFALLIRENRPRPPQEQLDWADANRNALLAKFAAKEAVPVEIFGPDGAVIGGRNIVNALSRHSVDDMTDVVIDVSDLSAGTSFPIIRYFVERIYEGEGATNVHVFVVHDPCLDANIRSITSDAPSYIHGFLGGSTLNDKAGAARLWLPQLATGRGAALRRLYDFVKPHDTCPILPFPASDPRLGDALAEEYRAEIENTWSIDARNVVYADEGDPLDLYRTILRLDDLRKSVFGKMGSMLVLSPLGSKVMALGALMAALERDLPVAYLESIGYEFETNALADTDQSYLIHLWLEGDVYLKPRPVLQRWGSL